MRPFYLLLVLFSTSAYAQISVGLFAEPSYNFQSLKEYDQPPTYDSIAPLMNNTFNMSFGASLSVAKDRVNIFHIKPGIFQYGFMLVREDLKLFDVVHPALGQIYDQSQAAIKYAYMKHRFQYAGLQLEYQRDITPQLKQLPVNLFVGGGISYHFLIKQDLRVRTEGFAIDEKYIHVINEGLVFEANDHLLSAHALFETSYDIDPNTNVYAQALIKVPFMNIAKNDPGVYVWMPAVGVGIRRVL